MYDAAGIDTIIKYLAKDLGSLQYTNQEGFLASGSVSKTIRIPAMDIPEMIAIAQFIDGQCSSLIVAGFQKVNRALVGYTYIDAQLKDGLLDGTVSVYKAPPEGAAKKFAHGRTYGPPSFFDVQDNPLLYIRLYTAGTYCGDVGVESL